MGKKQEQSRGYAREWLENSGYKQADLVRLLGYSKAKANAIWHRDQRLNEDLLEEIADLVSARPYEILISPEEGHKIRRLVAALRDVSSPPPRRDAAPADAPPAAPPARTRKAG